MKKILMLTGALLAGVAAPSFAGDRGDAALGSVLGGVVGAVVGNGMGGQDGAVMGAVIGAGAGAYIAMDDNDRDRGRNYYRGGRDNRWDGRGYDHRHYYNPPQRVVVNHYDSWNRYDRHDHRRYDRHDHRRYDDRHDHRRNDRQVRWDRRDDRHDRRDNSWSRQHDRRNNDRDRGRWNH
jgi:hypothetical protein